MDLDEKWMNIIARNMNSMDFAIIACIIGIVFFMKFNQHESKNKANHNMSIFLGVGFLMLVAFRIFQGIEW